VLLTRRQVNLLLAGGLVAAGCTGTSPATSGPLRGRRPDRVVAATPPATAGSVTVEKALGRRASVRSFTSEPLSDAEIGQLLWAAQGVTRPWGGRTAPSAGALYPLDVYVVTHDRLRHYLPDGHRLQEWHPADDLQDQLHLAARGADAVAAAPVVFVVSGTVARTAGKYGSRADRYVVLEAGHCAQNLLLQATALSLGGVTIGSFDDDSVRNALGLPAGETPYYVLPVGHPAG
jgi:SagB-type dehydrogenase family enzyme